MHINHVKIHPERITREDKKLVNDLCYDEFEFLVQEKGFSKIGKKNNFCINAFCYENKLVSAIYIADQNLETQWICCL